MQKPALSLDFPSALDLERQTPYDKKNYLFPISISDKTFHIVENLAFLGSNISSSLSLDTGYNTSIGKTAAAMSRLAERV